MTRVPSALCVFLVGGLGLLPFASADTVINSGETLTVTDPDNFHSTAGAVTIHNDATLWFSPDFQGDYTLGNNFTLGGGAGTANLWFRANDTDYTLDGTFTAAGTGPQTLALRTGYNAGWGNGDRESVTFKSGFADGPNGALGLQVAFHCQTASQSWVNLNAIQTFTGPIALLRGMSVEEGYLTIGARVTRGGTTPGSGTLGGGNYAGEISMEAKTILNYGSTAPQILAGAISGAGALRKSGSGLLTLTGANSYSGATTVANGTLALGAGGSIAQSATISLANGTTLDVTALGSGYHLSGGQTLTGSGNFSVAGTMTVDGGAALQPGGPANVGTLSVEALTLEAGSVSNFTFDTTPANDLVAVAGSLTINGGGVGLYQAGTGNPFAAVGAYNLFQYAGSDPSVSGLSVLNKLSGFRYGFSTAGNYVVLTVGDGPTWTGGGTDDNWSTAANWTSGPIQTGDRLVFDGSARLNNVNDPAQAVTQLSSLVFNPTAGDGTNGFTLGGKAVTLAGDSDGYLIRNDTPAVTHAVNLPITVGAAGKSITTSEPTGTTALGGAMDNNGHTITVNGAGNTTVASSGTITGTGGLAKSGSGRLAINAATTYSGETQLTAGTLQVGHSLGLQQTTVSMSGGTLDLNGLSATLGGLKGSGIVTIPAGTTLSVGNNGGSSAYAGVLDGDGHLQKVGGGTLTLSAAAAYTGNTTIAGGTLKLLGLHYNPGLAAQFVEGDDPGPISAQGTFNAWLPTRTELLRTTTVAGPNPPAALRYPNNDGKFTGLGLPDRDHYTVSLTGVITITVAGTYQFALDSDDGSMLWIDGVNVVSNNNYQGMHGENDPAIFQQSGSIALAAGNHDIQIGMYEGGGGDGLNVSYNGDDTGSSWAYIPNAVLAVVSPGPTSDILPTATPLAIAAGAALDLNGVSQRVASLADHGGGGGGSVTNGGSADVTLTLSSGITAPAPRFGGAISDGATNKIGLVKDGGGTQVLAGPNAYTGGTTVNGGTLQLDSANALMAGTSLAVTGAAKVALGGSTTVNLGNAVKLGDLNINGHATSGLAATLDLNKSKLIADKTQVSVATLRAQIKSAYAGGTWTGGGIASGAAAADRAVNGASAKTGVGYLDNAIPSAQGGGKTTWQGRSVDSNSVLVRFTYYGDCNLDGQVNLADFGLFKLNFGTGTQWYQGDFDYSGSVNLADFGKLKQAFGSPAILAGAAVPEPSVIALLLAAGLAAAARPLRRRRHK